MCFFDDTNTLHLILSYHSTIYSLRGSYPGGSGLSNKFTLENLENLLGSWKIRLS